MGKLEMSLEERRKLLDSKNAFDLADTRFSFINDHKGFRKKCFHLLIGTAGQGKSTLTRSLLLDLATKHKVFLFNTEETLEQTKTMFAQRDASNSVLSNVKFLHQTEAKEISKNNLSELMRILEVKIMNSKSEILFFDNITTWGVYNQAKPDQQGEIKDRLAEILVNCNIPGFFVAHTANGIKDDQQALFGADDVRGSKHISNTAEFLYAYQKFVGKAALSGSPPVFGTVRVLKARGYDVGNIYSLSFDFHKSEYTGDVRIPNTKFKEIYDERFKLR